MQQRRTWIYETIPRCPRPTLFIYLVHQQFWERVPSILLLTTLLDPTEHTAAFIVAM